MSENKKAKLSWDLVFKILLAGLACLSLLSPLLVTSTAKADENTSVTKQEYPSYMDDSTIVESGNTVFVTIDGTIVESLDQVYLIVGKALKLPEGKITDLKSLQLALSDKNNFSGEVDLSIIAGEYLRLKIGNDNLESLLSALNDSEDANKGNLLISFWQ